jgi:hypothetical protein
MTDEPLTVADLIDLLAAHDPDTPVRLAAQPEWPFAYALAPAATAHGGVIWLATTDQLGYLPGGVRDALTDAGTPTWT